MELGKFSTKDKSQWLQDSLQPISTYQTGVWRLRCDYMTLRGRHAFSFALARRTSDCRSLMMLLLEARSVACWSAFCLRPSHSAAVLTRFWRACTSSVCALFL